MRETPFPFYASSKMNPLDHRNIEKKFYETSSLFLVELTPRKGRDLGDVEGSQG
ncbi:hypothetical protein A2U01_0081629, partial [Trifolium medium]|nr:hypothetical protein [Trifolium medium]